MQRASFCASNTAWVWKKLGARLHLLAEFLEHQFEGLRLGR